MHLNLETLIMSTTEELVGMLMSEGVLVTHRTCLHCKAPMVLKKTKDTSFGVNWRCMCFQCPKYQTTVSILKVVYSKR
jgi:hypothetical protein